MRDYSILRMLRNTGERGVADSHRFDTTRKVDLILKCYNPTEPVFTVMYAGISLGCLFVYPLVCSSCRLVLIGLLIPHEKQDSYLIHVLIGMALITVTSIPALFISDLSLILGLGGAFTGPPLVFLFPAVATLRRGSDARAMRRADSFLKLDEAEGGARRLHAQIGGGPAPPTERLFAWVLLGLGVVFWITAVIFVFVPPGD